MGTRLPRKGRGLPGVGARLVILLLGLWLAPAMAQTAIIVLAPGTLPDGTSGSSYSQAITASGGTAPYTFAVTSGALPAGLALDAAGNLTGTPAGSGPSAFTITATDSLGLSGSQAYTLAILAAPIAVSPATLPDGIVGVAYDQAITASGGTAPYSFAVTLGSLPPGLTLAGSGVLSGVPTQSGTFGFSITATDASGTGVDGNGGGAIIPMATAMATTSHDYTLVIQAATITLAPTTLPAGAVGEAYEHPVTASGGTAPYTYAVTAGALPAGLGLDGDGLLSGTPTSAGNAGFTITATDAFGQTGSQAYTVAISAPTTTLPDPTGNPDVTGLLRAQAAATRAFATMQIVNFVERLETLHVPRRSGGTGSKWGFWLAGALRNGDRDPDGHASGLSFETSGVSGGVDYSPDDSFAFGIGLGYGRDRTAIGHQGSRSDAEVPASVGYGSWHPVDLPFFLDGMVGYQALDFELQRFVPETGATVRAPREGTQKFTSWSGGYEYENEDETWMWSAYGRADAANAELEPFSEQGDDLYALRYGEQDVRMRTTTLGLRMKFQRDTAWGSLEPRFRVEFQRDFHEDDGVAIGYAHLPAGPVFLTAPASQERNRAILELGGLLRTQRGLILRLDYRGIFGGFNGREHWVRFSMEDYDD